MRLEKIWNEYISDECATLDTDEQRKLSRKIVESQEYAFNMLNQEQKDAVEKFVDNLYESEALFLKKAFLKGCEFSFSFLFDVLRL